MSKPKRHHYLPQFYLENFTQDGFLWVYDREQNEYRKQTPKNTAVQHQYYTYRDTENTKQLEIEKMFSRIEGETSPIIAKLNNKKLITPEEKEALAIFISFQKVRVPDFEKMVNEGSEKLWWKVLEFSFSSEKSAAAQLAKVEKRKGKKFNVTPQQIVESVHNDKDKYKIEFPREHSLRNMLTSGLEIGKCLFNMDWIFCSSPKKTSFVTSDNPFVVIPPKEYDPKGFHGVGIATTGATKLIPLSTETCLVITDFGHNVDGKNITKEKVRHINLNSTYNCDRFLIARDRTLLEYLVKTTRINTIKRGPRIHVG